MKQKLLSARKVIVCLDIWTTKGLTASFLGISACFFCIEENKPQHAFLALRSIEHPHTGVMISDCLSETLNEWNIKPEQVLIVITDNEANMVKALKCVNENLLEKLRGDQLQNSGVPSSKDEEDEEGGHVNETDDDTDTDSESENSRDEQTENKTEGTEAELTVTDASQVHMISIDDFQEALQYSRMPCQAHIACNLL